MKIKCKSDSSYDVPKKMDERSSIGSEFHKAAQTSGVQDLRSIVFLSSFFKLIYCCKKH